MVKSQWLKNLQYVLIKESCKHVSNGDDILNCQMVQAQAAGLKVESKHRWWLGKETECISCMAL